MKIRAFSSAFLLGLMGGVLPLPAQTAAEQGAEDYWRGFEQAIEFEHPLDDKACIGKRILFQGGVIDGFIDEVHGLRPNPLRVRIGRIDPVQNKVIDTGIVCCVTLLPSEIKPVAGHPAASILVRVLGKITAVNSVTKTVDVESEATTVTSAD